jgi:hypothetical protein
MCKNAKLKEKLEKTINNLTALQAFGKITLKFSKGLFYEMEVTVTERLAAKTEKPGSAD